MKKFILTFSIAATICSNAFAATYYFSSSTGSNSTGDGSINNPWASFYPNKSSTNALSPDDICLFKAGDTFSGTGAGYVIVDSSGTSGHKIIFDRYGAGADPIFTTASITTGWTLHSGSIYKKAGLFVGTYTVGVDGTSALGWWGGTNTTLPAGSFRNESGTVYVRLADSSNPSGHTMWVPTAYQQDENRGIIKTTAGKGDFVSFNHMTVHTANGIGISLSRPDGEVNDCTAIGNGRDGISIQAWSGTGELPTRCHIRRCTVKYNNARGNSFGQAITVQGPYSWVENCTVFRNFKEGIDFLDYPPAGNAVQYGGAIYNTVYENNQDPSATFGGAGIYFDGAHDMLAYGNIVYSSGTLNDASHYSANIAVSTEHQAKPVYNIHIINNLMYESTGYNLVIKNGGDYPSYNNAASVYGCTVVNNTMVRGSVGYGACFLPQGWGTTSPKNIFKNNLVLRVASPGSGPKYPLDWIGTNLVSTKVDSDYNLFYDTATSGSIVASTGESTPTYTLAQYKTLNGTDTNSIGTNPRLIDTTFATFDAHLQRVSLGQANTSPAIGAGTATPWTPPQFVIDADVLADDGAVVGSTRSDGVSTSASDIGFHYYVPTPNGNLTATTIVPADLNLSHSGSVVASFTLADDWPSDGKLIITFPTALGSGFTFSSPSTSTASFTSGGSGSLAVSTSSNVMTLTRSGGSTITATSSPQVTITNIRNPNTAGSTGAYQMQTTDSAGTFIDTNTNITASTITASALTSTSVVPASLVQNTTNNVNIGFTTATAWPSTGKLEITFPTTLAGGFTFNSTGTSTASFTSGGDGSLSVSIASNVVTLTRSGGTQTTASTPCVVQLTKVLNPNSTGSTGTFTIKTQDASSNTIDQDAAVAVNIIAPSASSSNNSISGTYSFTGSVTITRV